MSENSPRTPAVLVVTGCFPPAWSWGGQTRSIWNLCTGLSHAGARVHVVTTNADLERRVAVARRRDEQGMTVATLPVLPGRAALRYGLAPGLVREIWRAAVGADLCVMQGIWTFPLAVAPRLCRARGLPYVIVPRGTLEEISLSEKAWKKRLYLRLVERGSLAHAAAIQFASEDERRRSSAATAGLPALVHPNTVEFCKPAPRDPAALRRRLGLDEDSVVAGISGRLHPRKGFDLIVPALTRVPQTLHLVAFGADEAAYGRRIAALAAEHGVAGRVHFAGQLDGDALAAMYASIDLLVLPSHGESFGNTAIEALAQGTEVLLSDQVPLREWIVRQGLGEVVVPSTAEGWAGALTRWLARRARFDRERAAHATRAEFDLHAAGLRLLDDYRKLCRTRAAVGHAARAGIA